MKGPFVWALAFGLLGSTWSTAWAQSVALPGDPGALAKVMRLARRDGEAASMLKGMIKVSYRTLRDERVHGERMQCLLDLGRFDEADELAKVLVPREGGQAIPLAVAMARLTFRRGDLDAAEQLLARVRQTKPKQLDLSVLAVRIATARGDYSGASRLLQALQASLHEGLAADLEVDIAVGHGAELMAVEDLLERAIPLLRRAVELAPDRVDARALYVRALARWQRSELAESVALDGLEVTKGAARADLLHALGFTYLGIHRETEAVALFEEALRWSPSHSLARVGLARSRWKAGDAKGAREQITQLLASDPENFDALLLLADIESSVGDWDKAADALQAVLDVKPRHLKGLWLLSRVRARQRRPDEVQALVDRYEARKQVLAGRK